MKKQHGYILLPVVILLTLVATVAFMLNNESALDSGITTSKLELKQAEQIARAGMEHATWGAQNSGCAGDMGMTTVPFGQPGIGSYTATVTTPGGATTAYPNLAADQDAWFRSDDITNNNGGVSSLHLRMESGNLEYAVVRFDLSTLPAGSQINSATVRFYVMATKGHPQGPVQVHRVTADWTETGATWETMSDKFDSTLLNIIPSQPQAGGIWVSMNLTAQVQAWVNGGEANYGIMLIPTGEGTHAEYISREGVASQQPHLDVIVGTGAASPMAIIATGTLTGNPSPANDISRSLKRSIPAYQPAGTVTLQLGTDPGEDTFLDSFYQARNYGGADYMQVHDNGSDWQQYPLIRFDLVGLPRGASVRSARLELSLMSVGQPGIASVHRVARSWVEGTKSGGGTADGATWFTHDGTNTWTSAGGDINAPVVAETAINGGETWVSWEIAPLVERWLAGEPNHGLLIKPDSALDEARFASRENSNFAVQPRLTITYACECGSPCLVPQGSGSVLMVVINPATLVPLDAYKKALLESWGYTVTVVGESSNQSTYDAAIAAADVVFISETVNASQVGTKLANAPIGVVSQDGIYNDDLGIASGNTWTVASAINVSDASHYITAVFPTGPLEIYGEAMQQLIVSGGVAPGAQILADTGGAGSLVVLDTGAMGTGGTPLAGPRVMLPLGRDAGFNWDYLNASGRLVLHRALQWGIGAAPPLKNLLFVSGGSFNDPLVTPTAQEQLRIDLIKSWGYTVTLIHATQSQADFDAALVDNDVAYVSSEVAENDLGTRLRNAAVGVVNEQGALVDEFGFGQESVGYKLRNEIDVIDNTHYITEPFATGLLTIVSPDQELHIMTANKGAGFTALAQAFNTGSLWDDAMGVIEIGGGLFNGGYAAARRALLPWGDPSFDVSALNADGQELMQRTIDWAAGFGGALASASLWLATLDDVPASGAPGLESWAAGEILAFDEPNLALEPDTTNGTFASLANLDSFASDGDAEIDGLHYVGSAITVGGANSVSLQPGDVLITTANDETLTSNNAISVANEDVFVFRPATAGEYSAGDFIFLLDGYQLHAGADTNGISLVEKDTTIGDASLTAGSFLYGRSSRTDVFLYVPTDVGAGTTIGTETELVDGADMNFDSEVRGVDVAEDAVTIGGQPIPAGRVLLTLETDDPGVGDNNVPTNSEDIFYLTMTQTGTSSVGDATLLFDGSDVNLDTSAEHLQALTLIGLVAGGGSGGPPSSGCDNTYADDFETDDYTGSTGSLAWSGPWQEVGESDGPGSGDETISSPQGMSLVARIRDNDNGGEGLQREADLSGHTSAVLEFQYWRIGLDSSDYVTVELSGNGGGNWTEVGRIEGPGNDSSGNPQLFTYDISSFIATNSRLRLLTSSNMGNTEGIYIDDVQIQLSGCVD